MQDKYAYYEKVFRENYSKLYFYILNIINDAEHAEDIAEDVFTQVWERFDTLVSEDKPIAPLLYALARNNCIDYLRHLDVQNRYEESVLSENIGFDEDDDTHLERIAAIMRCIDRLPPQTRKVFEACYIDGKKYKEVSEEMDISVNTIKTYVIRALAFIRNEVGRGQEPHSVNKSKKLLSFVTYLMALHV